MNPSSKVPLIWAYLTFLLAFNLFFIADEELMPRYLSIICGLLASAFCYHSLKKSKPYLYELSGWKCFIINLVPFVLFILFNRNHQEFIANIFGSIMFFNLIVFLFYRMGADFSDIENTIILDNVLDTSLINNQTLSSSALRDEDSVSNLFQGSKQEQKKVIHEENRSSKLNAFFIGALKGGFLGYFGGWVSFFIISFFYSDYLTLRDGYVQMFDAGVSISFLFFLLNMIGGENLHRNIGDIPFREISNLIVSSAIFGLISPLLFWGSLSIILGADTVTVTLNYAGTFFTSATTTGIMLGVVFELYEKSK